ncbi:MAG: response regulator transcription factor [Chitinophagaceae bacterium]
MIKVALADDHRQVREIWHFILASNSDFEVVAKCCNGQEAIHAASMYKPDIFLMDINMQPLNGIEATEIITKRHPGVKVIGMSMHMDAMYVKRMLQAGARGYVTKNSSYEEVFDAIRQVNAGLQYICSEVTANLPGLVTMQP